MGGASRARIFRTLSSRVSRGFRSGSGGGDRAMVAVGTCFAMVMPVRGRARKHSDYHEKSEKTDRREKTAYCTYFQAIRDDL